MTPVQLVYFKIIGFGIVAALFVSMAAFSLTYSLPESWKSSPGRIGAIFTAVFLATIATMKALDSHRSHSGDWAIVLFLTATASAAAASFYLVWRWSWRAYVVPIILALAAVLVLHPKNDPLGYSTMGVFVAGIVFLVTGCVSGITAAFMRRNGETLH